QDVVEAIPATVRLVWDSFENALEALKNVVVGTFDVVMEELKEFVGDIAGSDNKIYALFQKIISSPGEFIDVVGRVVEKAGGSVGDAFSDFGLKVQGYMHDISLKEDGVALEKLYTEAVVPQLEAGYEVKIDTYGSRVLGNYFAKKISLHGEKLTIHAPFDKAE